MVRKRAGRLGTIAALLVALAACGEQATTLPPAAAPRASAKVKPGWQRLPDAPLSPRGNAVMASSGGEVFAIGGQDTDPCPPGASCVPGRTRRDGAALDLATGTWRAIAAAPIPVDGGHVAATDKAVYLLTWPTTSGTGVKTPSELLRYDIAQNRWSRHVTPVGDNGGLAIIGDRLLIYATFAEDGRPHDRILEQTGLRDLPPDPFGPSGQRSLVPVGKDRLILFASELDRSNGRRPSFIRAAELDLGTRKWRQLPKSNIVGGWEWWLTDGLLVAPDPGVLDGGEVDNWGRAYPQGGMFDPQRSRWLPLPKAPTPAYGPWQGPVAGGPELLVAGGHVLDPESRRWIRLPEPQPGMLTGRSAVWSADGEQLVAFGGAVATGHKLAFTAQTWKWQRPQGPTG